MTDKNKKLIRWKIEEEHWAILSPVCNMPAPGRTVSLLYENMDGEPCECLAHRILEPLGKDWWEGVSPHVEGDRILNPIAWKLLQERETDRASIVIEGCPHCDNEIEMRWDTDKWGFQAFCPVCGKILMLCNECYHAPGGGDCDYSAESDSCWRRGGHKNE